MSEGSSGEFVPPYDYCDGETIRLTEEFGRATAARLSGEYNGPAKPVACDGDLAEHFSDNYKAAFGNHDDVFAHNVTALAGQATVSVHLLDSSLLTMTEAATGLEVKATIDEVLFDDMRAGYGLERRFVVHEHAEHVEAKPTRRQRIRVRLGDVLRSFADRLSPVDEQDD